MSRNVNYRKWEWISLNLIQFWCAGGGKDELIFLKIWEILSHLFFQPVPFKIFYFSRINLIINCCGFKTILHHHTIYTFTVCIFNRIADDKKQKEEEKKSEKFQSSVFVILKMIFNFFWCVCIWWFPSEWCELRSEWILKKKESAWYLSHLS